MKFMLLIYGDEAMQAQATPEQTQAISDEYDVFTTSIRESGNFLDGDPFLPTTTAVTVSANGSGIGQTSGPAVTTSPQLSAYYRVQADSLEQAIEMAKRVPHAKYGAVEVRQVLEFD